MSRRPHAFLLLVLALSGAVFAGDETYGRSPTDLAMEDFLLHAEVVEIEDVGEGITEPRRLTLEQGGVRRRAIFKDIDQEIEDAMVHTNRFERGFSDKYVYEAAAYRVDRLVGIGLVPVTVIRTLHTEAGDETGSVQQWIDDATTLERAQADPDAEVGDFDLLVERLTLMYVLDALIYNVDRNPANILVGKVDPDVFHPIDHSRAFRPNANLPPESGGAGVPIPAPGAAALQAFDLDDLTALLGDLLDRDQIRTIAKRRDRLVKKLTKRGLLSE